MSYRTLLTGLADTETAPRVMAAASALANEHGAHVIALHVVPAGVTRESGATIEDLAERLREIYEEHRDGESYSSEWCLLDDNELSATGALIELGNACDALVLGQRHAREAGRSRWHLGEHIVGVTARPVLLVPEGGERMSFGGRVLVAWDGGTASTRAVFDALPLLQRATDVRVHRFNPPVEERRHVSGLAEGLAETLARHEVALDLSNSTASRLEIGEEILALADEWGADVIVMGCHVHSRVRQFLLGDTTRHVFANTTRPLLMGA